MRRRIFTKLSLLLFYLYYLALLYTAYVNPTHDYMNYLENATTLYMIIHIPIYIILGLASLYVVLKGESILEQAKKEILNFEEEKLEKLKKEMGVFESKKTRIYLFLSRILCIATGLTAFVVMGFKGLGFVMLLGVVIGAILINYTERLHTILKKEL